MKKKYVKPTFYIVHIEPEMLIASSPGIGDEVGGNVQYMKPRNFEEEDDEYWD